MDEYFRGVSVSGGTYQSKADLKKKLMLIKATLRFVNKDKVSISVSQYKPMKRKCTGARAFVRCDHHEDAKLMHDNLQLMKSLFHEETNFLPADYVTCKPRTFWPRYENEYVAQKTESTLYCSFKKTLAKK